MSATIKARGWLGHAAVHAGHVALALAGLTVPAALLQATARGATPASVPGSACTGMYLFCDDFDGAAIDPRKWIKASTDIAGKKVRASNLVLTTVEDGRRTIGVVDARMFGDAHIMAPHQGGVLITRQRFGGGRYEVRMRNLPGPNGCSCFWNYYRRASPADPARFDAYTEIDIEMPAHQKVPPAWSTWRHMLGLNTWSKTDADADATFINHLATLDPFDGQFHVHRFDWRDGTNGARRINWYMDGQLQASTTEHVNDAPAQLWVGTWPAPWPGMVYDFDVRHMYVDWVRISAL